MRKKKFKAIIVSFLLLFVLSMGLPPAIPVIGSAECVNAATPKINKTKMTLIKGQKAQLKITGTKSKVKWSSSKKAIAQVSDKGVVVAKKNGTATITASVGKKKYTCKVTVEAPAISKKSVAVYVGKSTTIKLTGTKQKVAWKSSNTKVATVKNGKITGKKVGTATITATVLNKKYSCKVSVKKQPENLIYTDKTNGYTFKYISCSLVDYYGTKFLKANFDFINESGSLVSPAFASATMIKQNGKSIGYTTGDLFPGETNVFGNVQNGAKKRVYFLSVLDDTIHPVTIELSPMFYFGNNPPIKKYTIKINTLKETKVY